MHGFKQRDAHVQANSTASHAPAKQLPQVKVPRTPLSSTVRGSRARPCCSRCLTCACGPTAAYTPFRSLSAPATGWGLRVHVALLNVYTKRSMLRVLVACSARLGGMLRNARCSNASNLRRVTSFRHRIRRRYRAGVKLGSFYPRVLESPLFMYDRWRLE